MTNFVSKLTPEQWAEVRRLRDGGATLADLSRRFGVTPGGIRDHARRHRWAGAPTPAADGSGRFRQAFKFAATLQARRALTRRAFRICELELSIMEKRMKKRLEQASAEQGSGEPQPADAADHTETDRIQAIFKTIDDMTELEAGTDPTAGGRGKSESGGNAGSGADSESSEVDAFRREIAERLERLLPPA